MPGLLDIAPPEVVREKVSLRGGDLDLRGLKNREWLMLGRRFPSLQKAPAMLGEDGELSPEALAALVSSDAAIAGLDMIAATIAIAIDQPGEETEAEIRKRLTDQEQQECFNIVMRLTHPPDPLAGSPAVAGQVGSNGATKDTPRPLSN